MQLSFEDKGHKYTTRSFQNMRTICLSPTAKLASFLFKGRRLSQASLELSSSRGCLAAGNGRERKKREERKEIKAKPKIKDFIYKNKNLQNYSPNARKVVYLLQNMRGIYRPPQGMKIPKTLITRLSYRTTM